MYIRSCRIHIINSRPLPSPTHSSNANLHIRRYAAVFWSGVGIRWVRGWCTVGLGLVEGGVGGWYKVGLVLV